MDKCIHGLIIAGPTGVGKTSLSVELAKKIQGEIISADSMQIYKKMDIGTAKITTEEMQGIPHHLLNIIEPWEAFTVSDYQRTALEKSKEITSRGKIPIIVGGTGLYINSLLYDMDFNRTPPNNELRRKLESIYQQDGHEKLVELLEQKDPQLSKTIDSFNIKRLIRAIEIATLQSKVMDFSRDPIVRSDVDLKLIVLYKEREFLYPIINNRVDVMIEGGLEREVKHLKEIGLTDQCPSMKGIGYRHILHYLEGNQSLSSSIEDIKRDSRRYAKRQLTWFKRYKSAFWLDMSKTTLTKAVEIIINRWNTDI